MEASQSSGGGKNRILRKKYENHFGSFGIFMVLLRIFNACRYVVYLPFSFKHLRLFLTIVKYSLL
jgi:hypothetical protein